MQAKKLADEFEQAMEKDVSGDYDIGWRRCGNDNFDGFEFSVESDYVPTLPILNVVRRHDDLFIAEGGATEECDQARYVFFVVEQTIDPKGKATLDEA